MFLTCPAILNTNMRVEDLINPRIGLYSTWLNHVENNAASLSYVAGILDATSPVQLYLRSGNGLGSGLVHPQLIGVGVHRYWTDMNAMERICKVFRLRKARFLRGKGSEPWRRSSTSPLYNVRMVSTVIQNTSGFRPALSCLPRPVCLEVILLYIRRP